MKVGKLRQPPAVDFSSQLPLRIREFQLLTVAKEEEDEEKEQEEEEEKEEEEEEK